MSSSPFKIKELAKEIEKAVVKDKDKEGAKEAKENKDQKDHKDQKDKDKDKDGKDTKDHKDQKDQKDHKEKDHKNEAKDKHEKELKDRKELVKEVKHEGKELETLPQAAPADAEAVTAAAAKVTEHKVIEKIQADKFVDKLPKLEKHEKLEWEKYFDKVLGDGKGLVETTGPVSPVDPAQMAQRIAALENAVAQLTHFIPENLRPDLTQGALKQEPDAGAKPAAPAEAPKDAAKDDKGKK